MLNEVDRFRSDTAKVDVVTLTLTIYSNLKPDPNRNLNPNPNPNPNSDLNPMAACCCAGPSLWQTDTSEQEVLFLNPSTQAFSRPSPVTQTVPYTKSTPI